MSVGAWLLVAAALAESPKVVLLTIEPGEDFVSKAGHATLCIDTVDDKNHGTCYNFGSTKTSDELALTLNYLRGTATFWVSTPSYNSVLKGHGLKYDRTIWRQDLALPEEDAWNLVEALRTAALPENKFYRYDHFNDNCTSRLRDAIDRATNGALSRGSEGPYTESWRSVARHRLAGLPWFLVGAELAGRPADGVPTVWQAMVLPEVLRAEVAKRLGAPARRVHIRGGYALGVGNTRGGALWIIGGGALFGWATAMAGRWRPRAGRLVGGTTAVLLGIAGIGCTALFFVSTLAEVRHNEMHAVFFAPDLLIPLLTPAWRRGYLTTRIAGLIGVMLLAGIGVFTQPTWPALAVLLALLGLVVTEWTPPRSAP